MRTITAAIAASLLALPACKDDTTLADKFQDIGRFTVTVDGEEMEYTTYLNTETGSSGITKIPAGVMSVWSIEGYGGVQDASPALPVFSVTIIQTGNTVMLDSIELISGTDFKHYRTNTEIGNQVLSDATISKDGKIAFGISADMQLFDTSGNSAKPVPEANPIHIEGQFSGTALDAKAG